MKIKFQISNFKFQISEAGFSLIELLVVMVAFMVTSSVIASVVLLYVKSVDKTNAETAIRQSGNGIISQMAKDIRNSGDIQCPNDKTLIISPKFTPATRITYSCDMTNKKIQKTISGALAVNLTDSSKMVLDGCTFTCSNPIITIGFTLQEAKKTLGDYVTIPFQTSVQVRNR